MYRIKQILSLLIAVSLMITSNGYSLPQSKTTLRPPLATSKMARELEAARFYGIKQIDKQDAMKKLAEMNNVSYLNVSEGGVMYLERMDSEEAMAGIREGRFIAGTYEKQDIVVVSVNPADARARDRELRRTIIGQGTAHTGPKTEGNQPDPAVRGAASVTGTISARRHTELNRYLFLELEESKQDFLEVLTPAGKKQFEGLPINLFCTEGILSEYGIAGHYGIRRFNIFLDQGLFNRLPLKEKERYFSHEVYELIRIIHYGMEKFGNEKMRRLALKMVFDSDRKITMENALKWFKMFSDFNKTNGEAVGGTLDELVSFLDRKENRLIVAPLLSGIHSQAPELPILVQAELLTQRLSNPSSEFGDLAILKEKLLRDTIYRFFDYGMEYPVRGAAGVGGAGASVKAAAAEAAGTGTAIAGTGGESVVLTRLDRWAKARGRKKIEPRKETLRLNVPTIPGGVPAAIGASL